MNSIYFPVQVALFLRRLVNVVSTISISNQYILHKKAQGEKDASFINRSDSFNSLDKSQSWRSLDTSPWPWWMKGHFNRILELKAKLSTADTSHLLSTLNSTSLPWLSRNWIWPYIVPSMQIQSETGGEGLPEDPPPSARRQNHQLPSRNPHKSQPSESKSPSPDILYQLLANPALYDPLRKPRYPIVLCHGLYGFDSRGPTSFPSMRMHYWSNVLNILRHTVGAEVIVTSVPGTGSISSRSERLDEQLKIKARGRGINFLAHSMGGLDCRHLISHIKPSEYTPLSLTTISTPHRGSPFMDWCSENIGIGKLQRQERELANALQSQDLSVHLRDNPITSAKTEQKKSKNDSPFSLSLSSLPSSFTTLLFSIVDTPAYSNLTSTYLNNVFNPATPDDPNVKYFSVAGRIDGVSVWHPFWLPKLVLDGVEGKERDKLKMAWEKEKEEHGRSRDETPLWAQEREWGNDGLVSVQSAKWGEFLGIIEGADHWEMRGARGIEFGVDLPALPALPAIGLGVLAESQSSGDSWDWMKLWKREEKKQKDRQDAANKQANAGYQNASERQQGRARERQRERDNDDDVVKSSTDRLSAVFDWLIDQMPAPELLSGKGKELINAVAESSKLDVILGKTASSRSAKLAATAVREVEAKQDSEARQGTENTKKSKKNGLASKHDLERFYVALSRKMYDEGL